MKQEVKAFIHEHQKKPAAEIALLLSKKPALPKEYILNQINGIQRAVKKFPFLLDLDGFEYPDSRAIEQSSSQESAKYKAQLVKGKSVIDLSGGMGMDSYFLSKEFEEVHYIEQNASLFQITSSNFSNSLQASNIEAYSTDALYFLNHFDRKVDLIYLDPDRRSIKEKAFQIEDCEPNVAELLPLIFQKSKYCLIKLSPMLDITQALGQLKQCKEVHVVSIKNECKELLFLLERDYEGEPIIIAEELEERNHYSFHFHLSNEKQLSISYNEPQQFLYEPAAAIRKAGAFKTIADNFKIEKLAVNTHLYTSAERKEGFPGRVLRVLDIIPPKKGLVKKANVVSRNFPMEVEGIKRKYKISDGGNTFLYACSLGSGKKVFIHCEKA